MTRLTDSNHCCVAVPNYGKRGQCGYFSDQKSEILLYAIFRMSFSADCWKVRHKKNDLLSKIAQKCGQFRLKYCTTFCCKKLSKHQEIAQSGHTARHWSQIIQFERTVRPLGRYLQRRPDQGCWIRQCTRPRSSSCTGWKGLEGPCCRCRPCCRGRSGQCDIAAGSPVAKRRDSLHLRFK